MSATGTIPRMIPCVIMMMASTSVLGNDRFYVFAADQKNQQVLGVSVNITNDGILTRQSEPLRLSFGPTSIVAHHRGKRLIVSSTSKDGNRGSPVAAAEVLEAGKLRVVEASWLEQPTGYTSVDRSGRFFLFANYGSGNIGVYRINNNGGVGARVCSLHTPRREAHCILTTRDNRFVYVPCVKEDNALYQYSFDAQTGHLRRLDPLNALPPAMFGPRHVAYHPNLPIAYFSNEQQLGVSVYEIGSEGQLTDTQHAVTMPRRSPFVQGKRDLHASDLVVSPDANRLFVAVRDFVGDEDSVFAFRIESDGRLSQLSRTKVGDIPWKLDLSPDGKYLLASEVADSRLSFYKIHSDGGLSRIAGVDWGAGIRGMAVVTP